MSNAEQVKQMPGDQDIHHDHEGCELVCARFPMKLHQILNDAEKMGFTSTIAWMDDGESFTIVDKDHLENEIMPRYFMSGKFKSFQRSLNLWGITCERSEGVLHPGIGPRRHHPLFVRGKLHLCKRMRRTRVKKPGIRSHKKSKGIDPASVHEQTGQSTQGTDSAPSPKENASRVNLSLPIFAGQVSVQSPYIQRIPHSTFQTHKSPYRWASSSLQSDVQTVTSRTIPIVAPLTERSTQSRTQVQEDVLLRYLLACRVRRMKENEAMHNKFHCNSLQL